jgi:hypothetical protein
LVRGVRDKHSCEGVVGVSLEGDCLVFVRDAIVILGWLFNINHQIQAPLLQVMYNGDLIFAEVDCRRSYNDLYVLLMRVFIS